MALTHTRSPSPGGPTSKRTKVSHQPLTPPAQTTEDTANLFVPGLFDHNSISKLHTTYEQNQPFKFAILDKLFNDDLLKVVKDECRSELSFTEKETDIYKVNQTGDLASLSYLDSSQISLLPNLLSLRNALYSQEFRNFLRAVTGCGPLSGTKQDMSVNSYTKGCHLLNHDDVIGSRRVSYILYMPLPHYQMWQKEWGGALELYPVPEGREEPDAVPAKSIAPSWNQFIFFEVQPGRSFHSVEEVVVGGEGEDGRERLSISGWFHAAQEGELGYTPEDIQSFKPQGKSSREQLASASTAFRQYPDSSPTPLPSAELSKEHVSFLSEFLNPVYLQPRTMKALGARFVEESSLQLHSFLCTPLAEALEPGLRALDQRDGLDRQRPGGRIPPHNAGVSASQISASDPTSSSESSCEWTVKGPPHTWRYCTLRPHASSGPVAAVVPRFAHSSPDALLRSLQDELFPSPAFRAWLSALSCLVPMRYSAEARRFRPGLDYTLATWEEKEARLDVVLGLTPEVKRIQESDEQPGIRNGDEEVPESESGWQSAAWGGWECYLAPHDDGDDPAVYRTQKKKPAAVPEASKIPASPQPSTSGCCGCDGGASRSRDDDQSHEEMDIHEESSEEEEDGDDDNTLLTVQPGFNRLLLVLRDERVMHFVKYVSASAEGSRWDVCGEFEVGAVEEDAEMDS